MKSRSLLLLVLALVLVAAASVPGMAAPKARVAIVFATGGLGDKSFNDSAFEGVQRAKTELGIDFQYAEPTAIAEYENFLTQFARTKRYDLIISIGFDQADALTTVSAKFPEQKFAIVDMVVDAPNVASYVYKEPERGFLVGAAAAMMTSRTSDPKINSDKVIGVIGGMDIPLINANIAGYMAGARYIDPDVKVLYSHVGNWADPSKGKELALAQIEQGADVIWGAAGRSGLGVIKAASEEGKYFIGADSDQGWLAPDNVLTNGMKFVNNTVFMAIKEVIDGNFQPGIHVLGVAEKALGYSKNLLPEDVDQKLKELEAKIVSGEIVVPDTIDKVDAWLEENR